MNTGTFKKILSTVFGVMLLLTMIFVITSCQKHVHTLGDEVVMTAATCEGEGVFRKDCTDPECEYFEVRKVGALGHDYVNNKGKEATCLLDGYKAYTTCSRCEYSTFSPECIISAKGHDWKPATCVAPSTCGACGETTGEIRAHAPATAKRENYVAAKCVEDGSYDMVIYCSYSNCKAELSRESFVIEAFGHNIVTVPASDPDCVNVGWYEYVHCSVCKGESTYVEIPALGHVAIVHPGQDATCLVDGWNEQETCEVCDYSNYEEMIIPAPGHDIVEMPGQDPTCTEFGWEVYTECSVCHEECTKDEHMLDPTGHTEAEAVVENTVGATCTADGGQYHVVYCSECSVELGRTYEVFEATGHSFSMVNGYCENNCGQRVSVGLAYSFTTVGNVTTATVAGMGGCTDSEVIIPAEINGVPVVAISEEAFYDNSNITSVVIPDSIKTIGINAFWRCNNLKSITIGTGLTSVERNAFSYCNALSTVYYGGSAAQWANITIGSRNDALTGATIKYAK